MATKLIWGIRRSVVLGAGFSYVGDNMGIPS